jgi:hypothetical protein
LKPFDKPTAVGLAAVDPDSIELSVRPTAAQRITFDQLKAISALVEEIVPTACLGTPPATSHGRLATVEKRTCAMLAAVRMLRPAAEAFYDTLTVGQKARFDAIRPAHNKGGLQCHDRG